VRKGSKLVILLVKKCHQLLGNRTCHRVLTFSTQVPTNVRFQMKPEDANDSSLKLFIFFFIQGHFLNCVPRVVLNGRKKRVKCWGDNSKLHKNSALYSAERSYSVWGHYFKNPTHMLQECT